MKEDKNFSITISWNVEDEDAILEAWEEDEGKVFCPCLDLAGKNPGVESCRCPI